MSNSIKAQAPTKTTRIQRKTLSAQEIELVAAMKGATKAEYNEIIFLGKTLHSCKRIISDWRKAGLPDAALIESVKAIAKVLETTDDAIKAKAAGQTAFNRATKGAKRGK